MKQKFEIKNLEKIPKEIKTNSVFDNLIKKEKIFFEIVVGNNSKITVKNIMFLYQELNFDKNIEIDSRFVVDKESELNEEEFYIILCSEDDKSELIKGLKKISLKEILK